MSQLGKGCGVCGSVASSEDHGYVVTLGLEGITAFLPTKYAPDRGLRIGQPVETVVKASRTFVDGWNTLEFGPVQLSQDFYVGFCMENLSCTGYVV